MGTNSFDYVIVGAGSAGSVVAARLSEDPGTRVALIEAGGPDDDPDIQIPSATPRLQGTAHDWGYRTVRQRHLAGRELSWPRGRTLGGSSSTGFQMWVPGHSLDYEPWVRAAGELWSWPAVEPYFRRSERWAGPPDEGHTYGTSGPLWISPPRDPDPTTSRFLDACVELGLPEVAGGLGGADNTGCALTPLTQRNGSRWSAADGYVRAARSRRNLRILTGAQVHRVLLRNGRATGVRLAGGRELTALREVIVCAGTVGSPQLLQLSGIGDPAALRRAGVRAQVELPGVGRNLQDHLSLPVLMAATVPLPLANADTPDNRKLYENERIGPLTSNIAEAVAFFHSDGGIRAPDLELVWAPVAFTDRHPSGAPAFALSVVLLQPHSRGRITLADANPASPPVIDPDYLAAEADLPTLAAGVRFGERVFETEALQPLVKGPLAPWPGRMDDVDLERAIRAHARSLGHPVGTCRMGRQDDGAAVVDPRLRVRGVEGLRVVDASVIPTAPRGHTHAQAVMVGERGADLIREDAER